MQSLENLESTQPGAKAEIDNNGLSVRRNTLGIGQAVDMAYVKSAKTTGGISQFVAKESTVAKLVLNRPFQARSADSLIEISGLSKTSSNSRKCLRPSEILESEKMVGNIINALKTQFLNPFKEDIDKSKLFKTFETRLTAKESAEIFFSTLKRNKFKSWKDTSKKVIAKKDGKLIELAFQRDILGIFVAHSRQYKSGIDLDVVLQHPLAPVSVPLSTPDGAIRKTVKSKLFDAAMIDLLVVPAESLPCQDTLNTYFLDVAAAVRSIVGKPDPMIIRG